MPLLTKGEFVKDIFSLNFRCSGKQAVILFPPWNTLYVAISNYIQWPNYGYFYFDLLQFIQSEVEKADFSWNFRYPAKEAVLLFFCTMYSTMYSNLGMHSVLILIFLFCFPTVYPNCMYKSNLFFNFLRVQQKKQWYCLFRGVPCI